MMSRQSMLSAVLVLCALDAADGLVAGASIRMAQPWPGHAEPSALLAAKLEGGQVVGRCGLEVRVLTEAGLTATDWPYNENAGATPQPRALLRELVVDAPYRRQGLGRQLCIECENIVRSWGQDKLMLFVDERNENAIALYEKLGYELAAPPVKRAQNPLVEFFRQATADPLAMRKRL